MEFRECPDIRPAKLLELRERITRLGINLAEVEENFARGGGKGGQKINKTSNCVHLRYPRYGIVVRCQRERKRSLNRFLALRELADRVEMLVSPQTSARLAERDRIRKRKGRSRASQERTDAAGADNRGPELGQD
ncbi:MAG: peptide chain release factor-like protein [Elusimicrobia bacterium]|nr:peptide chain release factor-like protein [Elusimicrobiota bacterium]